MSLSETLRRWLYPLVDEPEDDEPEVPPEPERHYYEDTATRTLYRTTLTFRNGDTESFYSYGILSRGEDFITFKSDVTYSCGWVRSSASISYDMRKVHVRLLSREPELDPIATEWWRLTYETDDCLDPYRSRDEVIDTESIDLSLTHAVPYEESA